jgi:ectoine hydroxylase-related dioxygenase (phytanoyl-CoA dioxygenase family)
MSSRRESDRIDGKSHKPHQIALVDIFGGSTRAKNAKVVRISDEEYRTGQTSYDTIQACVEAFHSDGIVILSNAVSHKTINHLNDQMIKEIDIIRAWPGVHYNHGRAARNISQSPPLSNEFLHEEIWANRHAVAVLEYILGPRPQLSFASSNVALSNSTERQAVHSDAYTQHLGFPYGIEVNIYLCDASPDNGSTEIWPGSHHDSNEKDHITKGCGLIKKESFRERARISPPFQLEVPKGSVCLRDIRLWHSGMANRSNEPRIMLGFIYFPRWFRAQMRLVLPMSAKDVLQTWNHIDAMETTDFVEYPICHLKLPFNLNFTQAKSGSLFPKSNSIETLGDASAVEVTADNYWFPLFPSYVEGSETGHGLLMNFLRSSYN